jgi:hypothetical protein
MAAQSWNLPLDAALRRLDDAYHGWTIWYVPLALGGLTWCGRRHADGTLFHATVPADLAEYISDADAALRGDPPATVPTVPEDAS